MCSLDGCDSPVFARDWCQKHYARWRRHGDPTYSRYRMDLTAEQRIEQHIDRDGAGGCWLWTGRLDVSGYARDKVDSREVLVHRWLWEQANGPMPDGLVSDHLCRVHRCVNPDHIEAVTNYVNCAVRGHAHFAAGRENRCMRGHDLTVEGYVRRDGRGRNCRACARERERRSRAGG